MKSLYRVPEDDLGSVIIVIFDIVTGSIALVYEESKPAPVYWKFPGGMVEEKDRDRKHPGDIDLMAEHAARREALEETGVVLDVLLPLDVEKKSSRKGGLHLKRIFAGAGDFKTLKPRGDEGEIVRAFTPDQAKKLTNFFSLHARYLHLAEEKVRALA